jgi:hypothetical protein
MDHIPVSLREPFALALVDVLSALEDAISKGDLVEGSVEGVGSLSFEIV